MARLQSQRQTLALQLAAFQAQLLVMQEQEAQKAAEVEAGRKELAKVR